MAQGYVVSGTTASPSSRRANCRSSNQGDKRSATHLSCGERCVVVQPTFDSDGATVGLNSPQFVAARLPLRLLDRLQAKRTGSSFTEASVELKSRSSSIVS